MRNSRDANYLITFGDHLCDDPDVIVLNVTGPGLVEFKLINMYNEKR
jgi:hypothetical protein